ncbi:MAG: DUF222 domain-containing protein [Propionibacteriales bacterium]|nr:DUF222 domain-containing protein [Propionibacteriales bacterium]
MTPGADVLTADPAAELHACLDRVMDLPVDRLGPSGQGQLLRELTRAEARIAALRLRVLAEADRSRTAFQAGAASTGQWAAGLVNADQARAHHDVGLAQGLDRRSATRQALAGGEISQEHAAVIVRADRDLPPTVTPQQRETVETDLVARARALSPSALRKAARRALAAIETDPATVDAHENDLVAAEEAAAQKKVRLTLHDNEDGTVTGHFTVPVAQGQLLRKILQTITAPRRGRLGASQAQVGDNVGISTDWARARGEAFCELIEHLPTDHLHPRSAATLVVTIAEDVLRGALRVARLDTGGVLSAGEARRLACTSGLVPAVLGGATVPLDLGRSSRLFSEAQRTALTVRHHSCAADGCDRPIAWCELHHLDPWSAGGRTDLSNAVPLCHFHHRRIHDPEYAHAREPDGSIAFRRAAPRPVRPSPSNSESLAAGLAVVRTRS